LAHHVGKLPDLLLESDHLRVYRGRRGVYWLGGWLLLLLGDGAVTTFFE
jgi:hypothetical protein